MPLIILESDNAERVEQTVYEDERELQDFVAEQPESIPLEDIDENRRVAVAAKEFTVDGEYADAVAFDQFGRIYIIETKLDENSDKRQVMAQAFDYGAALWDSVEATDFFRTVGREGTRVLQLREVGGRRTRCGSRLVRFVP